MQSDYHMVHINEERCIGCKACVAACSEHVEHKGISVIFVEDIENTRVATTCMHCIDAPCARSCPAEAITILPNGIVLSPNEALCISCKNCVLACPFGVMQLNISAELAVKCDVCKYRVDAGKLPLCVSVCPTRAISLAEPLKVASSIRRTAASKLA